MRMGNTALYSDLFFPLVTRSPPSPQVASPLTSVHTFCSYNSTLLRSSILGPTFSCRKPSPCTVPVAMAFLRASPSATDELFAGDGTYDIFKTIADELESRDLAALCRTTRAMQTCFEIFATRRLFGYHEVTADEESLLRLHGTLQMSQTIASSLQELTLGEPELGVDSYTLQWVKTNNAGYAAWKSLDEPWHQDDKEQVMSFTASQKKLYRFLTGARRVTVARDILCITARPLVITVEPPLWDCQCLIAAEWLKSMSLQSLTERMFLEASINTARPLGGIDMPGGLSTASLNDPLGWYHAEALPIYLVKESTRIRCVG
jgi:hypothetical protein